MKSRLVWAVGLAVCASGAYAADSSVTLYGLVDLGISSTHTSGPHGVSQSRTGLTSGGYSDSLIGLQGQEDLGNGWSTKFQLESIFDASTGSLDDSANLFNNSAWVGLASDQFGEFRLGRQHTVGQQFGSELEISPWADMGMGSTFKASDNYTVANAVNYLSPTWGGFSFGAGYSFDAVGNQVNGTKSPSASAALQYGSGPLLLVVTWDKTYLSDTALPDARDPEAWQLGGSYDFDVVKVSVAWSRQKNGYVGLDGGDPSNLGLGLGAVEFADGGHVDAYLLGVSVPTSTNGAILAQWSLAKPNWDWQDGEKAKTGQVATLGYVYNLSPRTTLYAMAGLAKHYSIDDQFVQGQGTTTRFMGGMSHAF